MKTLPLTENALVLRTDYSDEHSWEAIVVAIQRPVGDFRACVSFVSDPEYQGVTVEQLPSLLPRGERFNFMFVVDRFSLEHPEHPILALDLSIMPYRTFRVIPCEMWGVENNLSLANMDFSSFAEAVDKDGIYRGFSGE